MKHPILLMILDGWGFREESSGNAIALAQTPNYDRLLREYPHALLDASGHAVGLPDGIMGNSEVGHLNIGAGRIAKLGLTRIFSAIENGDFFSNQALLSAFQAVKKQQSRLHLIGLVSDGAVHSHQEHLYALLKMAKQQGVDQVFIHAFTDGRDTDPHSGLGYIQALEKQMSQIKIGKIATVMGRYYAMDRDQRWERTQKAYEAMVQGLGVPKYSAEVAIEDSYKNEKTDEFIEPAVIIDASGQAIGPILDQDGVIFFNFRADRARQITRALTQTNFSGFERIHQAKLSSFICMSEYDANFELPVAFPPEKIEQTLGEILSYHGLKQLRIAETEKYAHVTFFFNGGVETEFLGEQRILIPSPKEVPTYDLKPQMSALQLADQVIQCLEADQFDVVILNFANADMVGHTGQLEAAIRAVETVDQQIGKITKVLFEKGGTLILSADHGNCEKMKDAKGRAHTAHTTDLVPFILAGPNDRKKKLRKLGTLADIAPTILDILNIKIPTLMTGKSMIES